MPGVMTFPNCGSNVLTYLLVLAAAGGALVSVLEGASAAFVAARKHAHET